MCEMRGGIAAGSVGGAQRNNCSDNASTVAQPHSRHANFHQHNSSHWRSLSGQYKFTLVAYGKSSATSNEAGTSTHNFDVSYLGDV